MATKLNKNIARETNKRISGRNVIVTLAPAGSQDEALIGLKLKGQRTQYVVALSDVYRCAALWHGQKELAAKKRARAAGISWRIARREFIKANTI